MNWIASKLFQGACVLGLGALTSHAAFAAIIIVQSTGDHARIQYPAFSQLPDDSVITLQDGDALQLLTSSGSKRLLGPGRFELQEETRSGFMPDLGGFLGILEGVRVGEVVGGANLELESPSLAESLRRPEQDDQIPNSFYPRDGITICYVPGLPLFALPDSSVHGYMLSADRRRALAVRAPTDVSALLELAAPSTGTRSSRQIQIFSLDPDFNEASETEIRVEIVVASPVETWTVEQKNGEPDYANIAAEFVQLGCNDQVERLAAWAPEL